MALRQLEEVSYLPMLSVRPAEMVALQELPERDKDLMLPFFQLRPWVSAAKLDSAMDRLAQAYGERPYFLSLAEPEASKQRRDVHDELDILRSSDDGFAAWCQFVGDHPLLMPSLQLTDVGQFDRQAERLHALGRGTVVHVERAAFPFIRQIAARTSVTTDLGRDVIFVLDFGRQTKTFLLHQAEATGLIQSILDVAPNARVSISASSFPESFTSISSQSIYEREVFQGIQGQLGQRAVLYSDRGSARAERQSGGGGSPAPRIDFASRHTWHFFRSDDADDRPAAYQERAVALMEDTKVWDSKLRLWGTQMIERTALGDDGAIVSPARATAARINIHLHQQSFFTDPAGLYETDDDWTD